MGILDFTEIPAQPKGRKNKNWKVMPLTPVEKSDLDAFEKFAEEYFEKICGYKIISRVARGPDNAKDLIVQTGKGKWLVSCKHYAHSDRSVRAEKEYDPYTAIKSHGCKKFIGFYSTVPHGGLVSNLNGLKQNNKDFDFEILKNTDIESRLLDKDDATGWIFVARYFPKSYANMFRRFVVPISHYSVSDYMKEGAALILNGPYGGRIPANSSQERKEEAVSQSNDALTNAVHFRFFLEALKEFIDMVPQYFKFPECADKDSLKIEEVSPKWDEELSHKIKGLDFNAAIAICAVWTFWSPKMAMQQYLKFKCESMRLGKDISLDQGVDYCAHLAIGKVAEIMNGQLRDIFARLVAFCPVSIPTFSLHQEIVLKAKYLDGHHCLSDAIKSLKNCLSQDELEDYQIRNGDSSESNALYNLTTYLGYEKVREECYSKIPGLKEIKDMDFLDREGRLMDWGFAKDAGTRWISECLGV
ncbi:restriction endonuclease [Chromobacterium haemolyticum]|uniref:restriction endonuclease n=1 Tax=Chromobacterium TaxID=535 RepID=UPI004056778F